LDIGASYHAPGEVSVTEGLLRKQEPMSPPDGRLSTVLRIKTIKVSGTPTLHNFNFTLVRRCVCVGTKVWQ
jgi:hypothetical protein